MTFDAVVKVGGSLLSAGEPRTLVSALAVIARAHRLVVVPGGGPFADAVREVSARHALDDNASHWMAVLAMNQHAHLLAAMSADATLCMAPQECAASCDAGRLAVFAPYSWLRDADPLPHGWHVTSDSIAAWAAGRLGAPRLILLKPRDGVRDGQEIRAEADSVEAAEAGIVDAFLPEALPPGVECWILDGRRPERLAELLAAGTTSGTRLRERGSNRRPVA
ncbi:MAG TPA: protein kinase [Vicinamibacteria bacterium]|nr:protein kinase [Vicinamibacteria bacterium]